MREELEKGVDKAKRVNTQLVFVVLNEGIGTTVKESVGNLYSIMAI
jgi:hypothetical protein